MKVEKLKIKSLNVEKSILDSKLAKETEHKTELMNRNLKQQVDVRDLYTV